MIKTESERKKTNLRSAEKFQSDRFRQILSCHPFTLTKILKSLNNHTVSSEEEENDKSSEGVESDSDIFAFREIPKYLYIDYSSDFALSSEETSDILSLCSNYKNEEKWINQTLSDFVKCVSYLKTLHEESAVDLSDRLDDGISSLSMDNESTDTSGNSIIGPSVCVDLSDIYENTISPSSMDTDLTMPSVDDIVKTLNQLASSIFVEPFSQDDINEINELPDFGYYGVLLTAFATAVGSTVSALDYWILCLLNLTGIHRDWREVDIPLDALRIEQVMS